MSQVTREALTLERAKEIASALLTALSPSCERMVVAGSVRRSKPHGIKDIELVAIPRFGLDLFGEIDPSLSMLDVAIESGLGSLRPRRVGDGFRVGERFKALEYWASDGVVPVDLFVVLPPAEWGAILAIRTGPSDFSQHLVTSAHRLGRKVADGRVLAASGRPIPTPTEREFFDAVGAAWVEPEDRR